jgi:hypothetical protein
VYLHAVTMPSIAMFPREINNTLLHEIRHYMQQCANPCYLETLRDEEKIPYRKRPMEKDARAFAKQYDKQQFVKVEYAAIHLLALVPPIATCIGCMVAVALVEKSVDIALKKK